jgi:predicted ribonuclease YlaK
MAKQRQKSSHNSLTIRYDDLLEYQPLTTNQGVAFDAWDDDYNLVLSGSAGTGKTFMGMYLALEHVLDPDTSADKLIVIRSMVPTREMGFLPGDKETKEQAFIKPYKNIACELFGDVNSWGKAVTAKKIEFESTSFIRGLTLDNCVILVDEMQNCNFHELDSVITRVGRNSRIIFCGDYHQSDFTDFKQRDEKDGIMKFLTIVEQLKNFTMVNFGWADIVRSDFVRDYIMTKEMLGLE